MTTKATLKSLNAKYNKYGYEFVKTGTNRVEIRFDGALVHAMIGRNYVQGAEYEMKYCTWITKGECCEVSFETTPEVTEEPKVNPVKEALQQATDQDGSIDLMGETEDTTERYTVSHEELARLEKISPKVLTVEPKFATVENVKTSEITEMQDQSHFETVKAMNSRVSLDELNAYEQELQAAVSDELEAKAALEEIEALWVKAVTEAVEAEESKLEVAKQEKPVTPVQAMNEVEAMKTALNEVSGLGVYYDHIHSKNQVKFIVYKSASFDKNLGSATFEQSTGGWSVLGCNDRYRHSYGTAEKALEHLLKG